MMHKCKCEEGTGASSRNGCLTLRILNLWVKSQKWKKYKHNNFHFKRIVWTELFRLTVNMNEQNEPKWKLKNKWVQRIRLTWRQRLCCVSVCHPGVCVGCRSCQAAECVMSVRVSESLHWLKRAMWLPVVSWRLYCGKRWYVFLRKGPSRPFSSPHPPLHHRPSIPTPPRPDQLPCLGDFLITLISLTTGWRRKAHPRVVSYIWISSALALSLCDFCRKQKRIIECQQPLINIPFLHHLPQRKTLNLVDLNHFCYCWSVFPVLQTIKVITVVV